MTVTFRAIALISVFAAALALPLTAAGQAALQLITPYPAVLVEAGKNASFNIEVRTGTRRRVNLGVIESPPGWQATLGGGGFTINGVFGAPDNPPTVTLNVKVPPDAAKGDYRVLVRGESAGAIDLLELNLKVADVAAGAVALTAEFPSQRAAADATFTFNNVTLSNNTPEETTFNLSGQAVGPDNAPLRGWQVTVHPSAEQNASTVKVEGGGTATLTVEADPPDDVAAAKYDVKVRAEAGAKTAETTLVAEITGNAKIEVTTPNERLNAEAVAGRAREVTLVIKNDGTTALTDVSLTSSPPTGWKVVFDPERIPEIAPRRSARTVAKITPSGDAVAGDYTLTVTASGEGSSDEAELRVTVKTSGFLGLFGLVVIGAAIYLLLRVFGRYGRR